jgi:hypothetical protein
MAGTMADADAAMLFMEIDEWVTRSTAVFENKKGSSRRKPYWTGVGNIVKKCKVQHSTINSFNRDMNTNPGRQTFRQWVVVEETRYVRKIGGA